MRRILAVFLGLVASIATSSGALAESPPVHSRMLTGWSPANPGEMAILEEIEGENLEGARRAGGKPDIQTLRYDLNADGIDEILYYVDDPFFCGAGDCPVIVMHRLGADERWREVAAVYSASPHVRVGPAKHRGFVEIHAADGGATWGWTGSQYEVVRSTDAVAAE